jgi:hypothetical protein
METFELLSSGELEVHIRGSVDMKRRRFHIENIQRGCLISG